MNDDRTIDKTASEIDRRKLLKLGAGVGAGVVMGGALAANAAAQQAGGAAPPAQGPVYRPERWREGLRYSGAKMQSGPGWKHTSTRASGNGAMDATSRRIVEYVHAFSAADLTPRLQERVRQHDARHHRLAGVGVRVRAGAHLCAPGAGAARRPAKHGARLRHRDDTRAGGVRQLQHDPPHRLQRSHQRHDRRHSRRRRSGACIRHRRDDGDHPRLSGLRRDVGRRRQHRGLRCGHLLRAGGRP